MNIVQNNPKLKLFSSAFSVHQLIKEIYPSHNNDAPNPNKRPKNMNTNQITIYDESFGYINPKKIHGTQQLAPIKTHYFGPILLLIIDEYLYENSPNPK